jgi:pyochelin biosynthetic protein PchC
MTTIFTEQAKQWFRRYRPVERPRLRLVCFAHAGGGPSAFRSWPVGLPDDIEVLGVRYPGRQDRVMDECVDRMDTLADAVADALEPLPDLPMVMFGHSMGAWVAYDVALRLLRRRRFSLRLLVVSGQVPPDRRDPAKAILDDDDAVVAEVRRLGGYDAKLFEHPELRDLVLPAIRADFALVNAYRPEPGALLDCPILACFGDQDADSRPQDMRAWADTTTGPYTQRVFPGGHFYLADQEPDLLRELSARLSSPRV